LEILSLISLVESFARLVQAPPCRREPVFLLIAIDVPYLGMRVAR